jgi:hypothetical protein
MDLPRQVRILHRNVIALGPSPFASIRAQSPPYEDYVLASIPPVLTLCALCRIALALARDRVIEWTGQTFIDLGGTHSLLSSYQFHVFLDEQWDEVLALDGSADGCSKQLHLTRGKIITDERGVGSINVREDVVICRIF